MNQSLNFITSHDRSQLRMIPGLRNAIGVVLPLVCGILTRHTLAGLGIAIGAQVAGFAGLNGTARKRLRTMLFAAFWMAITTFIGAATGGTWVAVAVMMFLGFATGILICVSNEAGLVGMWATIAFIFISGTPLDPVNAFYRGLLVLAGGLLQTVLMIVSDLLSPSSAETDAIASVYRAISNYAKFHSRTADLKVASALLEADSRLRDSFMRREHWGKLRALLDLSESVRIEVVALSGMIRSLGTENTIGSAQLDELDRARDVIADALGSIAASLSDGVPIQNTSMEREIDHLQAFIHDKDSHSIPNDWQQAYACIHHAYDDLVKAVELLHGDSPDLTRGLPERWWRSRFTQWQRASESIRANLTFRSAPFRHAVRLALVLAAAVIINRVFPARQGYWLPLTALVILKPEFTTTFSRGIARVIGTVIGAWIATFLVAIPDTQHLLGVLLIGVFLWGMYTVLNYNMVLFSCLLTAEVTVLISFFQNLGLTITITDRVVYTIAGSVLAFIAYLAWPTWQHRNVPDTIANLIRLERQYLESVLLGASREKRVKTETHRKRTRLARTNAVNMINQAVAEPMRGALDDDVIEGLLTGLNRLSDDLLSLEAHVSQKHGPYRLNEQVVEFGQYVDRCLEEIETDVRCISSGSVDNGKPAEGSLDRVSPFTKKQLLEMDVPASLASICIHIEENIATMFRMVERCP